MESILGKIFASAMMCAATDGDPEVEAKKCIDEIVKELQGKKKNEKTPDTHARIFANTIASKPMLVKAEHKAEWDKDRFEVQVMGHPIAVEIGIQSLLVTAAMSMAKDENRRPKEIISEICYGAIHRINQGGDVDNA